MEDNKNGLEVESIEEMKQEIHQEEIKELLKDFKEEEKGEDVNDKKPTKGGFLLKLIASILDETLIVAVSFALLYLFDAIIKLTAGLFVAQKQPVFFIIVIVANIIYAPIIEATKVKTTVGKALLKI